MGSSRVGRAVLVGGIVGAVFAACAQGNQLSGIGGSGPGGGFVNGSTSTGKPDAGIAGQIGSPCTKSDDCKVGICTPIGNGKYCSQPCPPACPDGSYCSIINGTSICVPDLGQQCARCSTAGDCKLPSDACLKAPPGDTFCARDCTVDGMCPNGFVCTDMASYEAPDGGADAGGTSGTGGSDSGTLPTAPTKWCVPDGGASCPCNGKRDGVTHACTVMNTSGTCTGMETCDGKSSQWMGCTAATPTAEICNNKDDNCNGQIDEGDPNMLCAAMGPPPPHAKWACASGTCQLGACDPGWTSYPPGPVSAGCPCQVDANEPNGACSAAKNVGSVQDVGGAPITINGTLSSASNVDFYTFNTVDTNEATTNSYHVNIVFTQPTPNNEFVMDVMRGAPCSDTPSGAGTAITAYDWCVNASNGAAGEAPCGPTAAVHCADHSSVYFVRVYRMAAATATCTPYQITVTGGGGACDLTQHCP